MSKLFPLGITIIIPLGVIFLILSFPLTSNTGPKSFDPKVFQTDEIELLTAKISEVDSLLTDSILPILADLKGSKEGADKLEQNMMKMKAELANFKHILPKGQNNNKIDELLALVPGDQAWLDEIQDFILLQSSLNNLKIRWEPDIQRVQKGQRMYKQLCMTCHGKNGDGVPVTPEKSVTVPADAESSVLQVRPRDFTGITHKDKKVVFKFISTEREYSPALEDDLRNTIKSGLPGSPMPGFTSLSQEEIDALVDYIKTFAYLTWKYGNVNPKVYVSPKPPHDLEAKVRIDKGRQAYLTLCMACHGDIENGKDPEKDKTVDWVDSSGKPIPIMPRNFAFEPLKKGKFQELFNSIRLGIQGTPMPSNPSLSDEDTWDIISYILHLRKMANEGKLPHKKN
ncbi:MAG: cytochrome c [Planctomycetes bacterium]|nr:cytochrome c [Planctomycetota bacterium]